MPSSHVQGNLTYDSSSTPLPSDQHGEVKREEVMDDMSMSWGDEPLYASPAGAGPSSGVMPDHEQPSIHPPQTYEFEQKSFEASQSQDVWDYTQHQQLYIDTTPVTPQDYNMLPYGAVDAYGYIDSPMSVSHPDHHFGLRHSSSPRPSLHPIAPPPSSQNRSYTLEGAITPISPPSLPPPQPHPQPDPQNTNARSSSPPMGSLRPPSRPTSGSSVKVERSSSAIPPATGSSASASATPVISPEAPVPATAPLTKRPRGRPRKNPPSARPSSPPPHVDYPFPQFPDNPSSTSSSASPAYAGAGKGKAPEAGGVVPPIAGPVPVITAGTPGASGPMAGSSSCSQPRSHSHSDAAAAANVDGNATGKASSSSNVPPGLTAGQGIFRLNMPREGEETAAEPTGEKKKPIMACLFCRERKIACGPPPPGGPKRCNQCTRRDLVCEYPKESRRGQHKRGPRAVRVDELAAASGSAPSAIKPKPSKRKPSNIVRIDTVPPAPPAPNLASETDSNGSALPFPPSPLTPLSSPLASGSTSGTSPLVERPSRSEKVTIAQPAEGKERSRSRSHARPGDAWGDLRNAAARRAVQMQQKKRTIGNALAQAMTPQDVKMEVEVEYDFGGGSSTSAGATQNPSPLARPGMPPYGMCL
ncbi:hypothetical protein FKP32DRAFT_1642761 [Trametes sanguinea]|nr:hypothetical protein FKP32DRAFT_1642761 [Trametes sanguinea]